MPRRSAPIPTLAGAPLILAALGLLSASAGLCASAPAGTPATLPLYTVEIIVFRNLQPGPPEDWSAIPEPRGFGTSVSQAAAGPQAAAGAQTATGPQAAAGPQVLRVLPSREYALDGLIARMRASGLWQPIAHAAWIQSTTAWGTHAGVDLQSLGVNVPGLTGKVYLESAQYLHLGVDLSLTEGSATYRIDDMRAVRNYQLQYFDHPDFGVIAVVSRLRTPSSAPHG